MDTFKTKSLRNIERQMESLDRDSLRHHVLANAKNFKASWLELGRSLYSVWKDKSPNNLGKISTLLKADMPVGLLAIYLG